MSRPVVEVFADVLCPFTHVGLRKLVGRRAELGRSTPVLEVRAWPLELVNGALLDPETVAQHVDEIREQVEPELFRGFDDTLLPISSLPALALVAAAYDVDGRVGEQVSFAVRDAFFEEGRDISEPAVLDVIAARFDVVRRGAEDDHVVLADFEEGRARGVRGSPEFYLDGVGWFCPALRIEQVGDRLEIALNPEGFESFLTSCFA